MTVVSLGGQRTSDVLSFDLDFFLQNSVFFRQVNATTKNKRPLQSYDAKRRAKKPDKRLAKRPAKRPAKRRSRPDKQSAFQNK